MAVKGIQKAAMLLTMLDASTAMEMLKDLPQEIIQKIAMELSHLDARKEYDEELRHRRPRVL